MGCELKEPMSYCLGQLQKDIVDFQILQHYKICIVIPNYNADTSLSMPFHI